MKRPTIPSMGRSIAVALHLNPRLRMGLLLVAIFTLNTLDALAQAGGGGFSSTDLKTGISNSLAVIMLFGFVLGIAAVIAGGFAIRRGDVDTGKLSIIGGAVIPCVKGNHDEYSSTTDALENLNPRAASSILWTRQQLGETDKNWLRDLKYVRTVASFSIVHATLDAPHRWGYVFDKLAAAASFTYQTTSVCFYGHTHLPMAFVRDSLVRGGTYSKFRVESGRKYFVNAGSVGEPRDGNSLATYTIYNLTECSIELRRVHYDVARTEAKVREAGLPVRRKR